MGKVQSSQGKANWSGYMSNNAACSNLNHRNSHPRRPRPSAQSFDTSSCFARSRECRLRRGHQRHLRIFQISISSMAVVITAPSRKRIAPAAARVSSLPPIGSISCMCSFCLLTASLRNAPPRPISPRHIPPPIEHSSCPIPQHLPSPPLEILHNTSAVSI